MASNLSSRQEKTLFKFSKALGNGAPGSHRPSRPPCSPMLWLLCLLGFVLCLSCCHWTTKEPRNLSAWTAREQGSTSPGGERGPLPNAHTRRAAYPATRQDGSRILGIWMPLVSSLNRLSHSLLPVHSQKADGQGGLLCRLHRDASSAASAGKRRHCQDLGHYYFFLVDERRKSKTN